MICLLDSPSNRYISIADIARQIPDPSVSYRTIPVIASVTWRSHLSSFAVLRLQPRSRHQPPNHHFSLRLSPVSPGRSSILLLPSLDANPTLALGSVHDAGDCSTLPPL